MITPNINGKPFRCHQSEIPAINETISKDIYLLRRLIGNINPTRIVDVGAGSGDFTLHARTIFPDASVHSIEPNPRLFENLILNFSEDEKVCAHWAAVSLGEVPTQLLEHKSGNMLLCATEEAALMANRNDQLSPIGYDVDAMSIDSLTKIPTSILKINANGLEFVAMSHILGKIVSGMTPTIQCITIGSIQSVDISMFDPIVSIAERCGYRRIVRTMPENQESFSLTLLLA